MEMRRGDYVEYEGKSSKTIPYGTVVRVLCEATSTKTVVEALKRDGCQTNIVLANKHLKDVCSLF